MKTTRDKILHYLLMGPSWLYGIATGFRNWLFDTKLLKEEEFDIPVVGVGNITVGGTGKTPHVEYIVSNLATEYNLAVLSRGYKRHTKGFVLANKKSTPRLIGDEPYQIYQKFGHQIQVAVCESRKKGIKELLNLFPDLDLIVLDDSFQHRWVKPKVSILLTDYNRPFYHDRMLPLGRLRESPVGVNRADMVIVTKCPDNLKPLDFLIVRKDLELWKYQKLFFSRYEMGNLQPVFQDDAPYDVSLSDLGYHDSVLLLTGIAHPRHFVRQFKNYPFKVKVFHFPDHHDYGRNDIEKIVAKFKELKGEHKIIVTTEKDAVRLMHNPYFPKNLKPFIFYLPIKVRILDLPGNENFIESLRQSIEEKGL